MTILIGAIISAVFYRMGGMSGLNTKFRDFGCPITFLGVLFFSGHFTWLALISAVALFGSLTTYWDSLFGEDNLYFHGLVCGLAMTPLFWAGAHWWAILAYSLTLAITMGSINASTNKAHVPFSDWIEELFRGAAIILALPILLL